MSQKINSKNLSYDTSLPPFLAAMRAQAGGGGDQAPSIGRRQLGKKRSDSEEAEDAPVVLDEDGNVVDVDFEKDGTVRQREDEDEGKADEGEGEARKEGGAEASAKSAASIGGRKRKVGKVIGDAAEDKTASSEAAKADKNDKEDHPKEKKVKKKAKKIKLSFDEEDG